MSKIKLKHLVFFIGLLWMFIASIMVIEKGLADAPSENVWTKNIIFSLGWLVWAAFTPIIHYNYQKFSIINTKKTTFLLIHFGLSILTAFLYFVSSGFIMYLLWNLFVYEVTYFEMLLFLFEKFHFDLLIYWVLIGAFSFVDWVGLKDLKTDHYTNNYVERFAVKVALKILIIPVEDINYFEAYGDYVKVYSKNKFHLINNSMKELEENLLDPNKFVRIHRSTIINIGDIRELEPHMNKEFFLTLNNGQKLKVSRSYQENLRKIIANAI
ncbi:LytR/AlgR family response regulator transcription factor [Spongiimicrobium sp. 2-473A-2-J]|uniref:LytR/AlgR family response regulator transcription factor n=1 Tax=Eudoraea algarum TaxID=3417568 RepID=UPI003D361CAF